MSHITAICRYPVKGLSPDFMASARLNAGQTIPFDRAWAIENGASGFNPSAPEHMQKVAFLMLMRNERLAMLRTLFDEVGQSLSVADRDGRRLAHGALHTSQGRHELETFFGVFCHAELRGPARIVHAPNHAFTDRSTKCLSLINLETVRDIAAKLQTPIDPLRFRANLFIDGAPAWSEFNWVGGSLGIGSTTLRVIDRIDRCAATNVDPQTGARDLALPQSLQELYAHGDCGIYLTVQSGGMITTGDRFTPPGPTASEPDV